MESTSNMLCKDDSPPPPYQIEDPYSRPAKLNQTGTLSCSINSTWDAVRKLFRTERRQHEEAPQTKRLRQHLNTVVSKRSRAVVRHNYRDMNAAVYDYALMVILAAFHRWECMSEKHKRWTSDFLIFYVIDPAEALGLPLDIVLRAFISFNSGYPRSMRVYRYISPIVDFHPDALTELDAVKIAKTFASHRCDVKTELSASDNVKGSDVIGGVGLPSYKKCERENEQSRIQREISSFLLKLRRERRPPSIPRWQSNPHLNNLAWSGIEVVNQSYDIAVDASW